MVAFEIITLKVVKNKSLYQTVNFSIVSSFSKGPQPAFSEGAGPGTGSFYKVCQANSQTIVTV